MNEGGYVAIFAIFAAIIVLAVMILIFGFDGSHGGVWVEVDPPDGINGPCYDRYNADEEGNSTGDIVGSVCQLE